MELLVLFTVTLFTLFMVWCFERRPNGYPKGPWSLPLVGNALGLGKYPHESLGKLTKKYGPVIGLYLGTTKVVIIHKASIIREIFKDGKFADRPNTPFLLRLKDEKLGLFVTEGEEWSEQRRFVFHQLRDMGFGKRGCEGIIADEIYCMLERMRLMCDKPVDNLERVVITAITNVMLELMFGHRMDQHDDSFLDWLLESQKVLGDPNITFLYNYVPWVCKWLPALAHRKFTNLVNELSGFVTKQVQEHRDTYNENEMRDLTDIYIRQIYNTTDPTSTFYKEKGWKFLSVVLEDLVIASLDTTTISTSWLFAYLCQYPEIQEKCRKEILKEIGSDRLPESADKVNLPYCEATIYESLRLSSISPLAGMRAVHSTTECMGYVFPKGTQILGNVWHSNHDEDIWENPNEFRPERFITDSGKFKPNSNMLTFSTGKRVCPGESLARQQMFLYTVALLQNFSFAYMPGEGPPTSCEGISIIRHIKPFKMHVTPLTK